MRIIANLRGNKELFFSKYLSNTVTIEKNTLRNFRRTKKLWTSSISYTKTTKCYHKI